MWCSATAGGAQDGKDTLPSAPQTGTEHEHVQFNSINANIARHDGGSGRGRRKIQTEILKHFFRARVDSSAENRPTQTYFGHICIANPHIGHRSLRARALTVFLFVFKGKRGNAIEAESQAQYAWLDSWEASGAAPCDREPPAVWEPAPAERKAFALSATFRAECTQSIGPA